MASFLDAFARQSKYQEFESWITEFHVSPFYIRNSAMLELATKSAAWRYDVYDDLAPP